MESCSLEPEIVTILSLSKDAPRTLYEMSELYNTSFVYDCLEFYEVKQQLFEIGEREQKAKQDAESAKNDRLRR